MSEKRISPHVPPSPVSRPALEITKEEGLRIAGEDAKGYLEQELRKQFTPAFGDKAVNTNPAVVALIEDQAQRQHDQRMKDFGRIEELREELESNQYDPLLVKEKVLTRKTFDKKFEQALNDANRGDYELALGIVDADHFKKVNDKYGHHAGDMQLRILALALMRTFTRKGDIVGRFGGEEITFALPYTSAKQGALLVLKAQQEYEELQKQMHLEERPSYLPEGEYNVPIQTFSGGVAGRGRNDRETKKPSDTPILLFAKSDSALYKAKHTRDMVVIQREGANFEALNRNSHVVSLASNSYTSKA